MADQQSKNSEFEDYLAGKSNLSALYKQSDSGEPGKVIDDAILSAARQEVQKHSSASSQRGFRWYVPMALAASLILAVFIIRVMPVNQTTESEQIADTNKQDEIEQRSAAGRATPELMLQKINNLLAEGKNKEAEEEYEIFTDLFPNHEINYQKYPNLKRFTKK